MSINSQYYMHDSDRAALKALQAIPGFTPLLKAFMKVWNEKQFRIQNMSSNIRINERQLPEFYELLPPICEKLGIDVPEFYLQLDVNPNAYTSGDTKPFVVVTSGLLETMPSHLIPTVIAHECGHIACHHVIYHTMGRLILNGAASILGLSQLATLPLQMAFYYWMRCSEYSADRAAALYDGHADNIVEMCMRFSGLDHNLGFAIDKEVFLEQALEYKDYIQDSKWNQTLEFLMLSSVDHPLNAVRAYECNEWAKTERFTKMQSFIDSGCTDLQLAEYFDEVSIPHSAKEYLGKDAQNVKAELEQLGFTNITMVPSKERNILLRNGQIAGISINGDGNFPAFGWYPSTAEIIIKYHNPDASADPLSFLFG